MRSTILVVDDSKLMRSAISDALRQSGYDCRTAEDGDAALRELAACEFSLVLCDIEMPGHNGIYVLQQIRSTLPNTFVVMMTCVTNPETVMECIRLGATDYLMKPFTFERLLLTVRNVLDQRKLYLERRSYQETLEQKVKEQTEQIRVSMLEKAALAKEMEIAATIHAALTPQFIPSTEHLSFAAHYLPAGTMGGDYFDIFDRGDGVLDVVIADVAGHGIGCALIVAQMRGAFQVQRALSRRGCGEMLKLINATFHEDLSGAGLFVSMLYLRLDERNKQLSYACAGHHPALLFRRDGSRELLDAEGMIIGVLREVEFEERTLSLSAGDRLVLYTDGVVETENREGELFGMERLSRCFCNNWKQEAGILLKKALFSMQQFSAGMPPKDDVTVVVVTVQ